MIADILLFVFSGVCAGMLSSLFGLGGGVVVVPICYWIFKFSGMNAHEIMHMAVGTSLAVMVVTTVGSIVAHYRKGNIHPFFFQTLFPFVVLGVIAGTFAARYLHSDVLRYLFDVMLLGIIVHSIFGKGFSAPYQLKDCCPPKRIVLYPMGFVAGFLPVLLGIGGSILTVPFFRRYKAPMNIAAGTAVSLTPAVSVLGAIGYMWAGIHATNLPPHSFGYVSVLAFICLSAGSVCGVPIGMKIGRFMSDALSARIYIVLLIAILVSMLI